VARLQPVALRALSAGVLRGTGAVVATPGKAAVGVRLHVSDATWRQEVDAMLAACGHVSADDVLDVVACNAAPREALQAPNRQRRIVVNG